MGYFFNALSAVGGITVILGFLARFLPDRAVFTTVFYSMITLDKLLNSRVGAAIMNPVENLVTHAIGVVYFACRFGLLADEKNKNEDQCWRAYQVMDKNMDFTLENMN